MSLTHDQLWAGEINYSRDHVLNHEALPLAAVNADAWVSEFDQRSEVWYDKDSVTNKQEWQRKYTQHLVGFASWTEQQRRAKPGVLIIGDSIMANQFSDEIPESNGRKPGIDYIDAGYAPLNFAIPGDYLERMIYRVKTLPSYWPTVSPHNGIPDVPYAVIHAGINNVNSLMGEQLHPGRTTVGQPSINNFRLGQRGWASHPFNNPDGSWRFTGRAYAKLISKLIDELLAIWPNMKIVVVGFPDRRISGTTPGYVTGGGAPLGTSALHNLESPSVPDGWRTFFESRNWLWSRSPSTLKYKLEADERQRRCNWQLYMLKDLRFRDNDRVKIIYGIHVNAAPGTVQQFYAPDERTHNGTNYSQLYELSLWGGVHWSASTYGYVNRKIISRLV